MVTEAEEFDWEQHMQDEKLQLIRGILAENKKQTAILEEIKEKLKG